jgi:very-short-patch-repair endonuclease
MSLTEQLAGLPLDRVVHLRDASADTIAAAVAEDFDDLSAVVVSPTQCMTPTDFVDATLNDLETVALALLPAWLPDAVDIGRPDPAGMAAVRAAAARRARGSPHFAPFLAELATVALSGRRSARTGFPREVRCLGLTRVIQEGFDRGRTVLLVQVPDDRTIVDEHALIAGTQWLTHHGRLGVWLIGDSLSDVDWIPSVRLAAAVPRLSPSTSAVAAGKPHPASAVEAALEAVLASERWAAGRRWNQSFQSNTLNEPVRLDLLWPSERLVVELDGPEHCHPVKFEADRQRDVQLQLDGYAVFRFTNARVSHDVHAVVHQIGMYLRARRCDIAEGSKHGRQR